MAAITITDSTVRLDLGAGPKFRRLVVGTPRPEETLRQLQEVTA